MNKNTRETALIRAKSVARSFRNRAVGMVGAFGLVPAFAMAQDAAAFDPSSIVTKVATYSGYALVIILAFAAAVWGLRAAGLIGRK
jgi:hypothetical protein